MSDCKKKTKTFTMGFKTQNSLFQLEYDTSFQTTLSLNSFYLVALTNLNFDILLYQCLHILPLPAIPPHSNTSSCHSYLTFINSP